MVNVTSEELGVGAGVLLRALEPLQGIEMMQRFRKTTRMCDIARGPGRLAQAMQIDKRYDGVDLCAAGPLWLGTAARPKGTIGRANGSEKHAILRAWHPRTGISPATILPDVSESAASRRAYLTMS